MAKKYEIYHEVGWDEVNCKPEYKKLTIFKSEDKAIDFANDIDNIGNYGNMIVTTKENGKEVVYNERKGTWE